MKQLKSISQLLQEDPFGLNLDFAGSIENTPGVPFTSIPYANLSIAFGRPPNFDGDIGPDFTDVPELEDSQPCMFVSSRGRNKENITLADPDQEPDTETQYETQVEGQIFEKLRSTLGDFKMKKSHYDENTDILTLVCKAEIVRDHRTGQEVSFDTRLPTNQGHFAVVEIHNDRAHIHMKEASRKNATDIFLKMTGQHSSLQPRTHQPTFFN